MWGQKKSGMSIHERSSLPWIIEGGWQDLCLVFFVCISCVFILVVLSLSPSDLRLSRR